MLRKTNTMYEKVAAMLLAVVLLAISCCTVTMAAEVNLLEEYNPGFEIPDEGFTAGGNARQISDVAHSGEKCLSLANAGDSWRVDVIDGMKSNTNYTFSFWMQNSVADSLQMPNGNNRFTVSGVTYDKLNGNAPIEIYDWYVSGWGQLSTKTFGAAREGAAINVWRKVSINFSTPLEGCTGMVLLLSCAVADPYLVIDDMSLVETGKNLQRGFNGDFEALDESKDFLMPHGVGNRGAEWGTSLLVQKDPETGNHYAYFTENIKDQALEFGFLPMHIAGDGHMGKRHKVSFKMKTGSTVTPTIRFYKNNVYFPQNFSAFPQSTADTWETFTVYVNATNLYNAGKTESDTIWVYGGQDRSYDDMFAGFDESSLGFYKELTFYDNGSGSRFSSGKAVTEGEASVTYLDNALSSEKSIAAESLAELTAVEGYKTVTARAHYLPVENEDHTFDDQTITLFTGVYKYEKNIKTLVDLKVTSETSVGGQVIDAVGTVQVPENTATATYKVEAMAFNLEKSGITPILDKKVIA